MAEKMSRAQIKALGQYAGAGVTTQAYGTVATFNALVRQGYLSASRGVGVIQVEITPAGRRALDEATHDR